MKHEGVFIVGTGTGVGKTQVASALLRALADRGRRPAPFKPFESGVARGRPRDAEALRRAARSDDPVDRVCPWRLRAALAPGLAAAAEGVSPDLGRVFRAFASLARGNRPVVAEGAGGLLVPLIGEYCVADLARDLDLPILVVGRDELGTINHTALTVEALRARRLGVLGVVLVRVSPRSDGSRASNADAVATMTHTQVLAVLPFVRGPAARLADHARRVVGLLPRLGFA